MKDEIEKSKNYRIFVQHTKSKLRADERRLPNNPDRICSSSQSITEWNFVTQKLEMR